MTNADKFKNIFGLYATELWSMPEKDFLKWLNSEAMNCSEFPNNSDTISRQAAIDVCNIAIDLWTPQLGTGALIAVQDRISRLPSAQPRKGKWIRTRTLMHDGELYCDQCGQEHPEQKKIWNFCPDCGCRMEEGDSDEGSD
ncbi:MAG: hypothetical protein IIY21_17140 [Clostridiales bacterium]|nr:hypothetical protein [Clostridiales bacterium]